jgi:hypothetical protein
MYRVILSEDQTVWSDKDRDSYGCVRVSYKFPTDRPSYPKDSCSSQHWWLSDECHESVGCYYEISYYHPNWVIDIVDANCALLFKLKWGGR